MPGTCLGPHDTQTLSHPCPQDIDPPPSQFSAAGTAVLCPYPMTRTHLSYFLPLSGRPSSLGISLGTKQIPSTREDHGHQELMGKREEQRRREGPWVGLVPPVPGPAERAKGSQSAAQGAGPALMVAGQTLRSHLNPPYGSFPVRKWANCDISPHLERQMDKGRRLDGGVRRSHLAPGGRRATRAEGREERNGSELFSDREELTDEAVFLGHAPRHLTPQGISCKLHFAGERRIK